MNKLFAAIAFLCASLTPNAFAQSPRVGVSIQLGQPGFFGRLDINDIQQPQLIYREPRIIQERYRYREPLYLVVPYYHSQNWVRYCSRYDACGYPVYFVKEQWYNDRVVPRYRDGHDRRRKHDDDDDDDDDDDHGEHRNHKRHKRDD